MSDGHVVNEKLIRHLARLASFNLSDKELDSLKEDLQEILSYVERLGRLDLEDVNAGEFRLQPGGVMEPDVARPGLDREAAFRNAPDTRDRFFKAPPIIKR